MNTYAPAQKRQHDATSPQASGAGKLRPAAGVGLPLFMQADAVASAAGAALQRQCACGSQPLQAKLSIGASDDPLEQEADRVADQVLAAPHRGAVGSAAPQIQRYAGHATAEAAVAPASVDRVLGSSGSPLEPALRQDMEQHFAQDFSAVRVHTDATAEQSAHEVNAHAYTVGRNVVFGAGQFAPTTPAGRRLLAHELTHVVQQSDSEGIRLDLSNNKRGLSSIYQQGQCVSPKLIQRQGAGLPTNEPFLVKLPPNGIHLKATPSLTVDNFPGEKAMNGDVVVIKNTGGAATYKKVKDGTWSWIEIPGRSSPDSNYPALHGFIETKYIANLTVGPIENVQKPLEDVQESEPVPDPVPEPKYKDRYCPNGNVNDETVQKYVDDALAFGTAKGGMINLELSFKKLRWMRENDCCSLDTAAAEHYMWVRSQVASGDLSFAWIAAVIAYDFGKLLHLAPKTGDCPITRASSAQVRWASQGAVDGDMDYYRTPK